nr:MAG TPA: hypothetical protein [Caudoviricetes sp.]
MNTHEQRFICCFFSPWIPNAKKNFLLGCKSCPHCILLCLCHRTIINNRDLLDILISLYHNQPLPFCTHSKTFPLFYLNLYLLFCRRNQRMLRIYEFSLFRCQLLIILKQIILSFLVKTENELTNNTRHILPPNFTSLVSFFPNRCII